MTSNRPQTLRPDQARCLGLSGNNCIGEDVRGSAVRREPAGGAWTAKWAKDSLNRAVDITRSGSLPITLSRATARPPPRAASASSPWRASIAMARQTVHRAKSEAGYAQAPPLQDSMPGAAYVCLSLVIVVSGTPAKLLANR